MYLKLQPYRQQSLSKQPNDKLAARFYGPFEVLQKVGSVAYKLKLPDHARIHQVLHVSQLKASVRPGPANPTIPPEISLELVFETEPEQLLDVRSHSHSSVNTTEVLMKWQNLPEYEAKLGRFRSCESTYSPLSP